MNQGPGHHHGRGHLLSQEGQGGAEKGSDQDAADHQDVGHAYHQADLAAVGEAGMGRPPGAAPPALQPHQGRPRSTINRDSRRMTVLRA